MHGYERIVLNDSFLLKPVRTRVLRSFAPALLLAAGSIATSCGGDDFCSPGSYECSGAHPTGGTSGSGVGGASGEGTTGGSTGTGGTAASGGTAGNGATAGSTGGTTGGDAGAGAGGQAGSGAMGGTTGSGGMTGTAGDGEAGMGGMGPATCAPDSPASDCVLTTTAGVFVAPAATGGDDGHDGTQGAPVLTVAHALELAVLAQVPVYICAGLYKEHLVVTDDGMILRGGYTCDAGTWTYQHAKRSRVVPTTPGEALRLTSVNGFDTMDVDFTAPNATDPGASSVGVFVSGSKNVTFTRARITAGSGVDGAAGTLEPYVYAPAEDLTGNDASGVNTPGLEKTDCPVCEGTVIITSGGQGGIAQQNGTPGEPQSLGGGAGGTVDVTNGCEKGGDGGNAPAGADGGAVTERGSLTAAGWVPEPGKSGKDGTPGQGGGGGGGAKVALRGAGGGGACGGCGGKGAEPGTGGGASIAILAFGSKVSLNSSTLATAAAGQGGVGTSGQSGQMGGAHGNGSDLACDGGNGGNGGDGGASGGGAGGISVGVVYDKAASVVSIDTKTTIAPGTPGIGGNGGAGMSNKGIDGVAAQTLSI